jgi:dipeptidyl aminopeptidase/acylaminoacyl peptidase
LSKVAPYGAWQSPITADTLVQDVVRLSQAAASVSGGGVYWNESRPAEAGRQVVVRLENGHMADALPQGLSARTLVHEYGGASFAVHDGTLFVANLSDQRLWRVEPGGTATPITPEPDQPMAWRFADFEIAAGGRWLIAVHERHAGQEVLNQLVGVATDGSKAPQLLADGHDFFAAPRVSPDGNRLAWLSWDHPNMPWDGTMLWEAPLSETPLSELIELGAPRLVAGGPQESISQPRWSADGTLHFVSDRTGWWNLYSDDGEGGRSLAPRSAEFSGPDWVLGQSSYTFLADGRLVAAWSEGGRAYLGVVDGLAGTVDLVDQPYSSLSSLSGECDGVVAIAGSPTEAPAVVRIGIPGGEVEVLKTSRPLAVDAGYISSPELVEFPTEDGLTAHALFYAPRNPDFEGPRGERPPLIVVCHGGPTGSASPVLNLGVQYWTSRGLAVVDVDYGGSTGYGRPYRERLKGKWGIVDVDDCTNAARWLASEGQVDGARMAMRGGSAGGFTTLAALVFTDDFAAGASLYGVADLEALALETHKFESRYLDALVGPYPEAREAYLRRSPLHFADRLSCPVILFQGAEDKVVPPDQAETFAEALRRKGLPFAYLLFEGEQHGFRQAGTIKRVAEAELWFYGRVLGFQPVDDIEPVPLENSDAL